ncbi:Protein polyglycylase TTLL10-like [Oopsacas minuta]|uniref:Protein polyglycylase TTLL10-like n=1 Tax=Oopsacas minuta TaxID=111878 RepID=A0AAV7K1A3_9METZ|nr:Protein polyglycylase TTLL10-like [Oopsacas minuta]
MRGCRVLFSITFWVTFVPCVSISIFTIYYLVYSGYYSSIDLFTSKKSIHLSHLYDYDTSTVTKDCMITPQIQLLNYPPTYTFINKNPINVLREILSEKSWIYIDPKLKQSQLLSFLNRIDLILTHPTAYVLHKTAKIFSQLRDDGTQYINCIDRMYNVTGNKYVQRRVMEDFASSNGCFLDSLGIMPKTFLLGELNECKSFFRYSKRVTNSWILKPYSGEGGDGITVHSDVSSLKNKFDCKVSKKYLVQEYIKPLLLDGRKFDVRAYFLIARTDPFLVFYHHGYLRLSLKKFEMNTDIATHLVNTHVQSKHRGYKNIAHKHMWTFKEFQDYLTANELVGKNWVEMVLEKFLKRVAVYIFNSGIDLYARRRGSFQLVGLDCLVDDKFRPWFTEANNYPLWIESIPEDVHNVSANLGRDMLDLVFMLHQDPPAHPLYPGYSYGGWKLLYNQQVQRCNPDHSPYQPCHDFHS